MADTADTVVKRTGLQTVDDVGKARAMADSLVTSAIASLKQPLDIPTTKGVNTSRMEEDTEAARKQRTSANETIDDEQDRFQSANEKQRSAIEREGQAGAESVLADADRAKQEAELYQYFGRLFGVDTDPSSMIAQNAQKLRAIQPSAEAKLRNIQSMQSVSLLDNPLDWLTNQVILPSAIADYNTEAAIVNGLQDSIATGIKTGQDAAVFASKGIPTIIASKAAAEAAKIKANADKLSALAEENLAKQNVTFAVQKLANDLNTANATDRMTTIDLQNEQMKYTSLVNAINLADKHSERLLRAATLIERLEGTKGLDVMLAQYDKTMGHPAGTTTRYTFEKFSEPQRQNMVAIGAGSLGADPFEGMINWYKSRPGPGASPETRRFFDYLRDKSEGISISPAVQRLDERQKPAAISRQLKENIKLDLDTASREGSIFYEMSPAQMLMSGSIPKESSLAKVLKPLADVTGTVSTSVVLEAINKEYQNPVEAGAVISDYYTRNMQLRNSVMNTSLAGITLPKDYKYKKSMALGDAPMGGYGSATRMQFDLTRPEEATKYILMKRVSDVINKSQALIQ